MRRWGLTSDCETQRCEGDHSGDGIIGLFAAGQAN